MSLINGLLSLFHFFTLWRLRRYLRKHYPEALAPIMANRNMSERMDSWLFPTWFCEMTQLQWLSLCDPKRFPVYILGDDFVLNRVKRLRSSVMLALYAMLGVAVMSF
ncbi:MAG: hypothetical protein ACRBB0_09930 [Pelagimonas sp.]|uniref:hypothetical protein n=1 Tax=Pelagimonas sp. TaxID=2073170 RepID=UPI003D6C31C5